MFPKAQPHVPSLQNSVHPDEWQARLDRRQAEVEAGLNRWRTAADHGPTAGDS